MSTHNNHRTLRAISLALPIAMVHAICPFTGSTSGNGSAGHSAASGWNSVSDKYYASAGWSKTGNQADSLCSALTDVTAENLDYTVIHTDNSSVVRPSCSTYGEAPCSGNINVYAQANSPYGTSFGYQTEED